MTADGRLFQFPPAWAVMKVSNVIAHRMLQGRVSASRFHSFTLIAWCMYDGAMMRVKGVSFTVSHYRPFAISVGGSCYSMCVSWKTAQSLSPTSPWISMNQWRSFIRGVLELQLGQLSDRWWLYVVHKIPCPNPHVPYLLYVFWHSCFWTPIFFTLTIF